MNTVWRTDFVAHAAFEPFADSLCQLDGNDWPGLAKLNALAQQIGLCNAAGQALRFVRQDLRCSQRDYERSVLINGTVPSRERNWHDLFNALVWLRFPHTKMALNARQCAVLQPGERRSPASDAATLFDESGLLLVGEDTTLVELMRAHRWQEAMVDRRNDWHGLRPCVIGHALLEKMLTPWPAITAKCLYLPLPASAPLEAIDAALAAVWREGAVVQPAELFPLPILGIPGWWPANVDPAFYADRQVFRPARNHA